MKKILLLFTTLMLFFNSFGQNQMDVWKKSNKTRLKSGLFGYPKSFASKSPSGKDLIYEKVDHPDVKVETSSGKKFTSRPIVYKSKTEFSVLTYDGAKWAGTYTEDGYHVTNLTMDTTITETLDSSRIKNLESDYLLLSPNLANAPPPLTTTQGTIPSNAQFYDPTIRINKIVGVYVEVANDLYRFWGSNSTAVTNNVNTLLSNVIAVYDREGITVRLNKIYIWDTTDPYTRQNLTDLLTFTKNISRNIPTNPNAEFKHLLGVNPGQGGLSWINGFSDGYTTNPSIPLIGDPDNGAFTGCAASISALGGFNVINSNTTYSWPVYVFSHEMGHAMGSQHTQYCGWKDENGNLIGRLDSCYGGEYSSTAPNCTGSSKGIVRANTKGAIMSYCHINGSVSFLTGFGKYSRFALRSNLYGATTIPFTTSSPPSLTTSSPTSITVTSATLGGAVVSDGGATVTQRGVVWSTSPNPTISLSTKTTSGTGIGSFSSSVTSLIPGTTYYVIAYATNVVGTSYGQQVTLTTPSYSPPSITTNSISVITQTSATSGGNITNTGSSTITERGVCWSTNENPTISDTKTSNGTASGNVSASITSLTTSTTYYVRSYVTYTNPTSNGTVYGNQISFTTLSTTDASVTTTSISSIGATSARSGGTILSDGGSTITAKGVVWSTLPSPTILLSTKTNSGTGTSAFTSTIGGLTSGLTYYVRSYVTNGTGTYYGNELTFTTIVLPSVTLTSVTSIESTKADFNYTVNKAPTGLNTTGVVVSTINPPTYANRTNFYYSNFASEGPSTLTGIGLTPNTTYYCKAYMATDGGQEYYSDNTVTFTTNSVVGTPTILTVSVTSPTTSTMTLVGNLTNVGTSTAAKGFCWNTSPNPTISLPSVLQRSGGFGLGEYTITVTGLNVGTTYYVRSYATNLSGTVYGDETSVIIGEDLTSLTTTSVSSISTTTAISGGNITNAGGLTVTARGVVWSTSTSPTVSLSTKTSNGTGTGSFTSSITGLTQNTTYYVRSYATTSQGTTYGNEVSFTTLSTNSVPTVITTVISGISSTTATSGGTVTSDGGSTVTARGVCWSTNTLPTVSLSTKTSNGTGTGSFTSSITGLTLGVTYYVRAYATNSTGTNYGVEYSFVTTNGFPILTTTSISGITSSSASSGGSITSQGSSIVTARGVCWSTSQNPTISNSKTSNGSGTGTFTSSLTSLLPSTTYYVRSYATNSQGTAYGSQVSFTTLPSTSGSCQVSNLSAYKNSSNKWVFKFDINTNCSSYTVNVCRYSSSNPLVQPTLTTSAVACGLRNSMSSYVPSTAERTAGFIERVMSPQPSAATQVGLGSFWYSVDVKCNSASCSGSNTTKFFFFVTGL